MTALDDRMEEISRLMAILARDRDGAPPFQVYPPLYYELRGEMTGIKRVLDQVIDKAPTDTVTARELAYKDQVHVGVDGRMEGYVVGTQETMDGDEVMIVILVPADTVFSRAGDS